MGINHIRQVICHARYQNDTRPLTVDLLTDSVSGIFITQNDRDTRRTRHIERRYIYVRKCRQNGWVQMHFLPGDKYNIADLGTKNVPASQADNKLSLVEVPVTDYPVTDYPIHTSN